jgi:hypothetical protein
MALVSSSSPKAVNRIGSFACLICAEADAEFSSKTYSDTKKLVSA